MPNSQPHHDAVETEDGARRLGSATATHSGRAKPDAFRRLRFQVAAGLIGGALTLVLVIVFVSQSPLPALTPERFDQARSDWKKHALRNYNLEVKVDGMQPAVYSVVVRNGSARSATRNGKPLRQPRTFATWSVDGMFGTIASDVDHLRKLQDGAATNQVLHVKLSAEFDSQWNYPKRYRRIEQVRFGNNRSASWEVTRFEPLGDNAPIRSPDDLRESEAKR